MDPLPARSARNSTRNRHPDNLAASGLAFNYNGDMGIGTEMRGCGARRPVQPEPSRHFDDSIYFDFGDIRAAANVRRNPNHLTVSMIPWTERRRTAKVTVDPASALSAVSAVEAVQP
jgi:hypothetical protein